MPGLAPETLCISIPATKTANEITTAPLNYLPKGEVLKLAQIQPFVSDQCHA